MSFKGLHFQSLLRQTPKRAGAGDGTWNRHRGGAAWETTSQHRHRQVRSPTTTPAHKVGGGRAPPHLSVARGAPQRTPRHATVVGDVVEGPRPSPERRERCRRKF